MKLVFVYICILLNEILLFSLLNSIKYCFFGMEFKFLVKGDKFILNDFCGKCGLVFDWLICYVVR